MLLSSGAAALHSAARPLAKLVDSDTSISRPAVADRKFSSPAIESVIQESGRRIGDPQLRRMFEQCFPNTLDTTVFFDDQGGQPDTFVITGDIDAMWLRDSSSQVWPYLRFARQDSRLQAMLQGVVRRQARMVLIDPYANAFMRSPSDPALNWAQKDFTTMVPGIAERKWELDSLCNVIRLAHGYWRSTGDATPFDATWKASAWKIVDTFREQQRKNGPGPYKFQRSSRTPTDTLSLGGYGNPARSIGLIFSGFRPSDDACIYPLFIPANLFAVQSLSNLAELAHQVVHDDQLAQTCDDLHRELRAALAEHGTTQHRTHGNIWAYEVDGYGNALMMDDAGIPSLLSLPYLGCCSASDPLYQRTRRFVLSADNPYFISGKAARGVGSPHAGMSNVWPMGIIVQTMTSEDDQEILQCLRWLRDTTAGTAFIHESFNKDDPSHFTRRWFAWANTLFGELMLMLMDKKPALLRVAL